MTKIFRCSYYRSKQPEPPEEDEESAAGEYEYVDLEDGQGKRGGSGEKPESGGGVDSDGPLTIDVVGTILIGISCIMVGCFFLGGSYLQAGLAGPDVALLVIAGALLLALGAAALAGLALRGYTVSSWFRGSD
ncbi:hypothetical protein VPH35_063895 [Triticum aestivum]|uniref:uncharacterized protein n=1 Tax=Triticum aestivum TaxID=4565 RepID=UPI0008455B98|nr:uncharacterized protein LOC123075911 [Triticum aestivum]